MFRICFFPGSGSDSFLSPDPYWPKKRPKTRIKVEFFLYFIASTCNTVLFHQALPEPYQNHYLDHISLQNGRIRTFKTRIQIGEKTQIQNTARNGNRSFFNFRICVFLASFTFVTYLGFVPSATNINTRSVHFE